MDGLLWLLVGALVGVIATLAGLVGSRLVRREPRSEAAPTAPEPEPDSTAEAGPKSGAAAVPPLYRALERVSPFFEIVAHPRALEGHAAFQEGVAILTAPETPVTEVLDAAIADEQALACMGLAALAQRGDVEAVHVERVVEVLSNYSNWSRYFAFRVLTTHARGPVLAQVLARIEHNWGTPQGVDMTIEFVAARREAGEEPVFEGLASRHEADVEMAGRILAAIDERLGTRLRAELERTRDATGQLDRTYLTSFGRFLDTAPPRDVLPTSALDDCVTRLREAIAGPRPRSVLLVGAPGCGKTSALRRLFAELGADGWSVFEAGGSQILAGQKYIGELEERVRRFVAAVGGDPRFLWSAPAFHELARTGRHQHNDVSILDMLLPAIERGEIRVVGELRPESLERLAQLRPDSTRVFEVVRMEPLDPEGAKDLARRWISATQRATGAPLLDDGVLEEAVQLSRQLLGERAEPGALIGLLSTALERRAGIGSGPLTHDELIATLGALTGVPPRILDDREPLDLDAARRFFESRVLGQAEAVSCLVERIAMVKAGLTDPTRPQGVFLFTGPTGTGKTELAKALAELLFGSPDRMIRLDMSEFQTWESFARLLGDTPRGETSGESRALTHRVRTQPFSVILLDEFEKAHPRIWDVFLQVFDDGRLTDERGNVADCRHTMIILTANVGADPTEGATIGFRAGAEPGTGTGMDTGMDTGTQRALTQVFRREFLNRIDRVVSFRPLGKSVMRDILVKELEGVLERRGLRHRQWAVEWDESAIDFLLSRGFSASFGARPLKRAIDRWLLAPLARTIVTHQFPEGDQFLFVRADGDGIRVQFVDPDAPDEATRLPARVGAPSSASLRLESIALDAAGDPDEVEFLRDALEDLGEAIESEEWRGRKREILESVSSPLFWTSERRHALLGEIELRDRLEAGWQNASSLLRRLIGSEPSGRPHYPAQLVSGLAERLYLLGAALDALHAGEPQDAYVLVESARDSISDPAETDRFAARVAEMYRKWSARRRMTLEVLEERETSAPEPYRFVAAVSGYGAYGLLRPESGFHVLERGADGPGAARSRVRVVVVPQPDEPPPRKRKAHLARAVDRLKPGSQGTLEVVRRYRDAPSPLVRDSVRGWRTGRIVRVLDGDFDLLVGSDA